MTVGDPASDLWLFTQHYPELVTRLTQLKNLSFVRSVVSEQLAAVKFEFEESDSWIQMFDQAWWQYAQTNEKDDIWYLPAQP